MIILIIVIALAWLALSIYLIYRAYEDWENVLHVVYATSIFFLLLIGMNIQDPVQHKLIGAADISPEWHLGLLIAIAEGCSVTGFVAAGFLIKNWIKNKIENRKSSRG